MATHPRNDLVLFCRCPVLRRSIPADRVAEDDPCFGNAACPDHLWWTIASFEAFRSHSWHDCAFRSFVWRADVKTFDLVDDPGHRDEVAAVCSEAERQRLVTWSASISPGQPLTGEDLESMVEFFRLLKQWDDELRAKGGGS